MNESVGHVEVPEVESPSAPIPPEVLAGKWLTAEPEMEIALTFAGSGRARALLWGALLNEWLEACFELSDPSVAQVKLSWWGEALAGASEQSAHPLVRAFALETNGQVAGEQWHAVASAGLRLASLEGSPGSIEVLLASRRPLAQALAGIESVLWPQAGATDPESILPSLLLYQWRRQRPDRLPQPGWIPLQLVARHGVTMQDVLANPGEPGSAALLSDLASAILAEAGPASGSRLRRIRNRLDRASLQALSAHRAGAFGHRGWRLVWRCWNAARGVPA